MKLKQEIKLFGEEMSIFFGKISNNRVDGMIDEKYHLTSYKKNVSNAILDSLKEVKKMADGGKAYAEGGEAGNSFDDDDIAVYMCETEFGDDWFDGENYKDENVEAFYIAVHQYIQHLQGNLKLDKNEKPLYEGNLDNEDKKFIKDS